MPGVYDGVCASLGLDFWDAEVPIRGAYQIVVWSARGRRRILSDGAGPTSARGGGDSCIRCVLHEHHAFLLPWLFCTAAQWNGVCVCELLFCAPSLHLLFFSAPSMSSPRLRRIRPISTWALLCRLPMSLSTRLAAMSGPI